MRRMRHIGLCAAATLAACLFTASTAAASNVVAAWGSNLYGELGDGTETSRDVPAILKKPREVTLVSAGGDFSLALLKGGTVDSWGRNYEGELGIGTRRGESLVPVEVHNLSEATSISAGGEFSFALLGSGRVKAWGANDQGQLGIGTTEGQDEPVLIPGLEEVDAISASPWAGEDGLALKKNWHVWAWGNNSYGQLGIGTYTGPETCASKSCSTTPVEVHGLKEEVIAIAAGEDFALALLKSGHVMAWGSNELGELGDGTTEEHDEPVEVKGLSEVVAISAGSAFGLALLKDGHVMAWGANYYGELGDESSEGPEKCSGFPCSTTPVEVHGLKAVTAISAGGEHSLALENGAIKAWGRNEEGELGDGKFNGPDECYKTPCSRKPVAVEKLTRDVVGISAGYEHSLAFGPPGPVIEHIKPSTGPPGGGTEVTITGTNFTGATAVKFGATESPEWKVKPGGTEITAKSPAGSGKVHVTVTTSEGMWPTNGATIAAAEFRYLTPEAPDYGRCVEVTKGTGKYSNAGCTTTVTEGSYEWIAGVEKTHFTLSGGEALLETVGEAKITCTGESGSGEYINPKEVGNTIINLTGCEHSGAKCTSSYAAEGELVTGALQGELGWTDKKTGTVGLVLTPSGESSGFIEGRCGATAIEVQGSVIANVATDEMLKAATLTYKQSHGKQQQTKLEGVTQVLETRFAKEPLEQTGLALTTTQTNEEKVEVNAYA